MKRWLAPTLLIILALAFRLLGSKFSDAFPNFQPLSALFFCSGALLALGKYRNFGLALLVWLVTYRAPLWFDAPGSAEVNDMGILVTTLGAFLLSFIIGAVVHHARTWLVLTGSVLSAVVFHLVTSGAAWLGDPRYAKTATGLWQSLWTGAPGDKLPSWVFLQNMTMANLLFTSLMIAAIRVAQVQATKAAQAPAR